MKNITHHLADIYIPQKAIIIYGNPENDNRQIYVEAYDIDNKGCPINAHPLDVQECAALANALDCSDELRRDFLKPKSLLPDNILYLNPSYEGFVLWHTQEQETDLFFTDGLGIPSGKAVVPLLLWKADRSQLQIYALKCGKKPTDSTPLYHAPFFNVHENGNVCMGTVDIAIDDDCRLEDFIAQWQHYFFGSYFSHLIGGHSPLQYNIVQLWQEQVSSHRPFPTELLTKHERTIKDLIR